MAFSFFLYSLLAAVPTTYDKLRTKFISRWHTWRTHIHTNIVYNMKRLYLSRASMCNIIIITYYTQRTHHKSQTIRIFKGFSFSRQLWILPIIYMSLQFMFTTFLFLPYILGHSYRIKPIKENADKKKRRQVLRSTPMIILHEIKACQNKNIQNIWSAYWLPWYRYNENNSKANWFFFFGIHFVNLISTWFVLRLVLHLCVRLRVNSIT